MLMQLDKSLVLMMSPNQGSVLIVLAAELCMAATMQS